MSCTAPTTATTSALDMPSQSTPQTVMPSPAPMLLPTPSASAWLPRSPWPYSVVGAGVVVRGSTQVNGALRSPLRVGMPSGSPALLSTVPGPLSPVR